MAWKRDKDTNLQLDVSIPFANKTDATMFARRAGLGASAVKSYPAGWIVERNAQPYHGDAHRTFDVRLNVPMHWTEEDVLAAPRDGLRAVSPFAALYAHQLKGTAAMPKES